MPVVLKNATVARIERVFDTLEGIVDTVEDRTEAGNPCLRVTLVAPISVIAEGDLKRLLSWGPNDPLQVTAYRAGTETAGRVDPPQLDATVNSGGQPCA